jgi:hypothetical protein
MSSVCCHCPEMQWVFIPVLWGGGGDGEGAGMNYQTFLLLGLWEEAHWMSRMKMCDTYRNLPTVLFPYRPVWFVSTSPKFLYLGGGYHIDITTNIFLGDWRGM